MMALRWRRFRPSPAGRPPGLVVGGRSRLSECVYLYIMLICVQSPRDKLVSILNCCKVVSNLLSARKYGAGACGHASC